MNGSPSSPSLRTGTSPELHLGLGPITPQAGRPPGPAPLCSGTLSSCLPAHISSSLSGQPCSVNPGSSFPVSPLPAHRVKIQQDVGPLGLKVTHVAVREGGQLWGRTDGDREVAPGPAQDQAQRLGELQGWSWAPGGTRDPPWAAGRTFSRSARRALNPLRRVISAMAMPDSPALPLRLQRDTSRAHPL